MSCLRLLAWCLLINLHFPSAQPGFSKLVLLDVGEWTHVWLGSSIMSEVLILQFHFPLLNKLLSKRIESKVFHDAYI